MPSSPTSTPAPRLLRRSIFISLVLSVAVIPAAAQVAVRGQTIYTMAGDAIRDGVVVIRDGKVAAVGPASSTPIPDGFRVLEGNVVTPGLIDARTVVGLAGQLNVPHDQDQLDRSDPLQPDLRAIDGYNPLEELVTWVRDFGVTTIHTGHGPGAVISGQTMIVKTGAQNYGITVLDSVATIAATLGPSVSAQFDDKPGTRSRVVALLRSALLEAQQRNRNGEADTAGTPEPDLGKDALDRVLRGETPLLITAHRVSEISAALRLAREFDVPIILDGASEAYLIADRIAEAGVPVILHAPMARAYGEQINMSFESPLRLRRAGIAVALQSGFESYVPKTRVVLFEAAIAAAYGLSMEEALSTVTIDAARILGIDDRVGSLEVGKDGDVVIFDGDPLEYRSHVCAVVIDGIVFSETCR